MIGPALVFAVALAVAAGLRHLLVEIPDLALLCDPSPWTGPRCIARALTIEAFTDLRLGLIACAASLFALLTGSRPLAFAALAAAGGGLVLYCAGLSAPAALVAAVALLPAAGTSR